MLEQMRLQEGHLFQNESALALYLDAKAVALETIVSALRSEKPGEALHDLIDLSDTFCEKLCSQLVLLSPDGVAEYHVKSLHECCKIVARLLWPTQLLLTARPKLQTLLRGLCKRLATADSVKHGDFLALDPIKQDFVMREAFRRAIVNDCLVVFEDESVQQHDNDAAAELQEKLEAYELDDEILPSDSASQFGARSERPERPEPGSERADRTERPKGAHSDLRPRGAVSVIGQPDDEALGSKDVSVVGPLEAGASGLGASGLGASGAAGSVAGSVAAGRDVKSVLGSVYGSSVAPKVATAQFSDAKSVISRSSAATGVTSTSFRKPFNVRTVQLLPE